ncbi:hypothetical protein PROFUN_05894 [Planoprotostelium fungivorum]|uniref:Chitin-binding type-1 domain-containing protein n=1 Tax=Planoprotostelium fungivorum TaxID=1890364 RepID=A0A2P6NKU1_9EUKA|nr:hypothetical protein PROFUN_05894 [Planoprotostelium fungivorum]
MKKVFVFALVAFVGLALSQNCGCDSSAPCCSQYGYCGTTPEYCDPNQGCQSGCNGGGNGGGDGGNGGNNGGGDGGNSGSGQSYNGQVTFYGWNDNDPPSDQIASPEVRHGKAMQTAGTYQDPNTAASSYDEFPAGTILYVPFLQKYVIIEDTCAQCIQDFGNGQHHIDIWMGPNYWANGPLDDCEGSLTRDGVQFIANPDPNLPVDTTPFYQNNQCTGRAH